VVLLAYAGLQLPVIRLGDRQCALPSESVERIVRTVALTLLPAAPPRAAGLLNLQGHALFTVARWWAA
jgi:chemotaxis signal transduction protein